MHTECPIPLINVSRPSLRGFRVRQKPWLSNRLVAFRFNKGIKVASTWGAVAAVHTTERPTQHEIMFLLRNWSKSDVWGFVLHEPVPRCDTGSWSVVQGCSNGSAAAAASLVAVANKMSSCQTQPTATRPLLIVVLRGEVFRDGPSGTRAAALQLEGNPAAVKERDRAFGAEVVPFGKAAQREHFEGGKFALPVRSWARQQRAFQSVRDFIVVHARSRGWRAAVMADVSCPPSLTQGLASDLRVGVRASLTRMRNFSLSQVASIYSTLTWAASEARRRPRLQPWNSMWE